jgi:hypothetical protein
MKLKKEVALIDYSRKLNIAKIFGSHHNYKEEIPYLKDFQKIL